MSPFRIRTRRTVYLGAKNNAIPPEMGAKEALELSALSLAVRYQLTISVVDVSTMSDDDIGELAKAIRFYRDNAIRGN